MHGGVPRRRSDRLRSGAWHADAPGRVMRDQVKECA
jgi:hypothetical protein